MKKLFMLMLLMLAQLPAHAAGLYPISGWYWNPDRPGTGFNIKLQKGSFREDGWIFAAGYVYDEQGRPTFITLQGEYQPYTWEQIQAADGQYIGSFQSEAYVSNGGQCIGCPYTPANTQADASLGPVQMLFTDLDEVEIRFKNDTWNLQVMDWHDDPPLSQVYDPQHSEGLRWSVRGVAVMKYSYSFSTKYVIEEKSYFDQDYEWLASNRFFTEAARVDAAYGAGTWPDDLYLYSLFGCDWQNQSAWNKGQAQQIHKSEDGSCPIEDIEGSNLVIFTGPDGKLWFATVVTRPGDSDLENQVKNYFATYGGVVGRLYTARNEFVGIGLYKAADFFPSRMGLEMVSGSSAYQPRNSDVEATYIHFYRGALDPERYGDGDLVPDTFWETGSIFGTPWQQN